MTTIWFSHPIWLVSTCVLRAVNRRTYTKFQQDSLKTEILVCIETYRQTDMATSSQLGVLIKNIYLLYVV